MVQLDESKAGAGMHFKVRWTMSVIRWEIHGIDLHEIVDTCPYNKALTDYIINSGKGNTAITNHCRNGMQRWNAESSCSIESEELTKLTLPTKDRATSDNMNDVDDLEMPLLESHPNGTQPQFPLAKIAMLCVIWIAYLAGQVVHGSSDGENFFGIETCGTIYWIVTLVPLPLAMVLTVLMLLYFQRDGKKEGGIVVSEEAASLIESESMTFLPLYALLALRLGGGMISSPIFLDLNMYPQEIQLE